MTVREIQGHLRELYAVDVSPDLISRVTDAVLDEVREWQNRLLDAIYPVIFFDALRVKIRDESVVKNKAVPTSTAVADFFFADSGSGRTMELGPLERSIMPAPPGRRADRLAPATGSAAPRPHSPKHRTAIGRVLALSFRAGAMVLFIPWRVGAERRA